MKKIYILLCALAAFAAASCSLKEMTEPDSVVPAGDKVQRTFSTLMTRTALQEDGKTVVWEAEDSISVFDGVGNNKFLIDGYDASAPSSSARFTGTVDEGATQFYAVYPYAAGNTLNGSTVSATVPAIQTAKAGSFDSGAAVVAAYTTGSTLAFHNVTALVGIKLSEAQGNVASLVFKGNAGEIVGGAVKATLSEEGAITAIEPGEGSKTVTLSGTFTAGGMYYLAFIPQEFSEGITVTALYADGTAASLSSSLEWEAVAGKSYNVVDFGTADYLEFASDAFTFDYGETKTLTWSGHNVSGITGFTVPAGWSYTALGDGSVQVTAPVKTVVLENTSGSVYQACGKATLAYTSQSGAAKSGAAVVRLRGINSSDEFDEFRLKYGNGSASYAANNVSYAARLISCEDYMIDGEITLNDDISVVPQNSTYRYYILHHIEHNLNGNGKTITMNVTSNAWPAGFCQQTYGAISVHDVNLAGTIHWIYNVTAGTSSSYGRAGGFAGQVSGTALSFTNVNNAVNITWDSPEATEPVTGAHHNMGGFVGMSNGKELTFTNCTYSGTITKNCRHLATGGFIGWSAGKNIAKFDGCKFAGTLESTATSSKAAWTNSTNFDFFGGFVGATDAQATALVEFKGCESAGTIKVASGARELGGFVGKGSCPIVFADDAAGTHCAFSGKIDYTETEAACTMKSMVPYFGIVGGFLGLKTANYTTFTNCVATAGSEIKISGGAFCAGGFLGQANAAATAASAATATTFTNCRFEGKLDYTTYASGNDANKAGRIGGFIGQNGYHEVVFNGCSVASTGVIESHNDVSNSGGFVGNGGDTYSTTDVKNIDRGTVTMSDCQFHGTLIHTATAAVGARRIGGFVGDASRVVSLTNCTNDGAIVLHENGKGTVGCGGFLGRTTALANNHTMKFDLTNCVYSGSFTVYNAKAPESTAVFGTVIGANPGFAVTTIDGAACTANVSVNYGDTTVTFATE